EAATEEQTEDATRSPPDAGAENDAEERAANNPDQNHSPLPVACRSIVKRRFAWRSGFEAPMYPKVLAWRFARHALDHRIDTGGVGCYVLTREIQQWRFQPQGIAAPVQATMEKGN